MLNEHNNTAADLDTWVPGGGYNTMRFMGRRWRDSSAEGRSEPFVRTR